ILRRVYSMFPNARFIHLVQHPRSYEEGVIEAISEAKAHGPVPQWLLQLACCPDLERNSSSRVAPESHAFNPSRSWCILHMNICEFLKSIPDDQSMLVRAEDLFAKPAQKLRRIAGWMGLRTGDDAVKAMQHPERSPYARLGPPNAVYGN